MDVSELRQLLGKPEWADIEIKKSARQFPSDAASTLCAFANCGGGYLILGVDEKQSPVISGIDDDKLDDVQNQCLGLLQDTQKFSSPLVYDAPSLLNIDGKHVLVVQIQDSKRQNKPVKLKEKGHWLAYVRKGARDEVANDTELTQMMMDASGYSVTDQLLDLDVEHCFNSNTLKWYRKVFESRHNQKFYELSNLEFLDELGLVREERDELQPTRAAVLMFGREKALNHILSRNVVDAFWYNNNLEDSSDATRWRDRRPLESESLNLLEAWRIVSERYMYWAEQPFDIDESNLHRSNETPDYIGFREAMVNLLVHQDFADHTRVPKIEFYKDISRYWNPGDSLIEEAQMRSGQSKSRNPLVMQTFHRIGLSERAGSGIKEIYRSWQHLDRPEPVIENSRKDKTFQITLGKTPQVSDLQNVIRGQIGVSLTDLQSRIFVAALMQVKSVEALVEELSVSSADIYPAIDHLVRQSLLQALPTGYQAFPHFAEALPELVADTPAESESASKVTKLEGPDEKSDQAQAGSAEKVTKLDRSSDQLAQLARTLSKKQAAVINAFNGQMGLNELMSAVGVTHRTHFKNKQLQALIERGLVAEQYPDNPNHPGQAYYLTEAGKEIKQLLERF